MLVSTGPIKLPMVTPFKVVFLIDISYTNSNVSCRLFADQCYWICDKLCQFLIKRADHWLNYAKCISFLLVFGMSYILGVFGFSSVDYFRVIDPLVTNSCRASEMSFSTDRTLSFCFFPLPVYCSTLLEYYRTLGIWYWGLSQYYSGISWSGPMRTPTINLLVPGAVHTSEEEKKLSFDQNGINTFLKNAKFDIKWQCFYSIRYRIHLTHICLDQKQKMAVSLCSKRRSFHLILGFYVCSMAYFKKIQLDEDLI